MKRVLNVFLFAAIVSCCIAPQCCAKEKEHPVYIDPTFRFQSVDTIFILSTIDLTVTKVAKQEELLLWADKAAPFFLKYRGYNTVPGPYKSRGLPPSPSSRMSVSEDELKDPEEAWVRSLGPEEARWVFVLALEDASSHLTFGSSGKAIVMGMLLDKQSGKLVWRAIGVSSEGQYGLLGMAMKGVMSAQAVWDAVGDLCSMIDAPKKKKK